MPQKEWFLEYQGNEIRVSNTWLGGAKLYINKELRDKSSDLFAISGKRPLLSSRLTTDGAEGPLVEVYMRAIFTVKAKVFVNGRFVAGDVF